MRDDEPVIFPAKKVPTRLKHWLLDKLLFAWGGIIINGMPPGIALRFCFVDTCCGSGLYRADGADDDEEDGGYEPGSALIGPQALARLADDARKRGRAVHTRVLLINSKKRELDTAHQVIREAPLFQGKVPLEKAVDEIDYAPKALEDVKEKILEKTKDWLAFVFIDPYGLKPTPFSVVSEIVRGKRTDTLINFPAYSLRKWTGHLDNTTADALAKLAAADAFMGGTEWRDIAREAKLSGRRVDGPLLDLYLRKLTRLGVSALALPLRAEGKRSVMYHLVFTSHNVAGLQSAKEKFQLAESKEYQLQQEAETRKSGQMSFLEAAAGPKHDVDAAALADQLHALFVGKKVPFEAVIFEGLTMPYVLEADVRKALTKLKTSKPARAEYPSNLKYKDDVTFKKAAS